MKPDVKIIHNPRCSKSRQALELIKSKGIEPEVILYLEQNLSKDQIRGILNKLSAKPRDILRKSELEYKDNNLSDKTIPDSEVIEIMEKNPKLIERPIVINGDKAAIGRPPENVLKIL